MKAVRKFSIRQSLWLGVVLAAASAFLGGGILHLYLRTLDRNEAEKSRARAMAEAYAAEFAPVVLNSLPEDIQAFTRKLPLHPGTCLLAVLDRQKRVMASRGDTSLLEPLANPSQAGLLGGEPVAWPISGDSQHRMPPRVLAAVSVRAPDKSEPIAFLVYAVRLSEADRLSGMRIAMMLGGLAVVSLGGVVIGFLWLRSRVLIPLVQLAEQARMAQVVSAGQASDVLSQRSDEIGKAARAIAEMRHELNEACGRATNLEQAVDRRVAAETQRLMQELRQAEEKVATDPLTRLGNRQLLLDKFTPIFEAQNRAGKDLSLVLLDVDHFKEVNDTLGHKAGDELLVFIGDLLHQCLREQDLAIRYGGDEFLLILPSVDVTNGAAVAERILSLFAQQARVLAVEPKPSMSAGVASLWAHQTACAEDLLDMADHALYEAKKSGRSHVRVAGRRRIASSRK